MNVNLGAVTTATLTNLTRAGSSLRAGDQFHLVVTGAPGAQVRCTGVFPGGVSFDTVFGTTDASGIYTLDGVEGSEHIGSWSMTWSVGDEAAPTLNIEVLPAEGTITEEDLVVTTSMSEIPTWVWALGSIVALWFLMRGRK